MTGTLDSLPLIQALISAMETALGAGTPVHLGGAPRDITDDKFAVMYPDSGLKSAFHRNLVNDGPDELRYQITSVGVGPEQALWVADRCASALLANTPTVSGRRVWKTVEEGSQPLRRDDESTGMWFSTAQYLTRSDPT